MKKNKREELVENKKMSGIDKDFILNFFRENLSYLITIIVIVIAFNIKLPYYIYAPGGTIDISDRIECEDSIDYSGSLNMLYVREYEANIPTYLLSFVFRNWDLESIEQSQISNESMEEIDIRNKIMLDNSVNNAMYVAYNAAGKEISVSDKRNVIIGTMVETNLKIGDEILRVNGKEVEELSDIKEVIESHGFDEEIVFEVLRDGKIVKVEETVKKIDDAKAIGVVFVTDYVYDTDPDIELKFKESESGSSGGLMMALSIYSAISDVNILKDRDIAGTGTIDMSGNVGAIAGVKYKIMGAVRDRMDVVLVPGDNYEEAIKTKEKNNYDIEIVKVDTFQDAIDYLLS